MKFWALSYSIPANPSRYRVAVWKALKELGAVYLQPAVAVVPQREGLREALLAIRERVLASGGTAALLSMAYDSEADEQAMLGAIQAAREEEYGEITADARRLLAQLNWEERQETAPPDAARYALECRRLRRRCFLRRRFRRRHAGGCLRRLQGRHEAHRGHHSDRCPRCF